ncbi:MAG: hypothetical protein ABI697_12680 [Devosia sp.]
MADYKELLRKAVEALPENNGAARRAVYEKARAALVGQLRAINPPLAARDITTHRLQLEDCIRQVEQEASEAGLSGIGQDKPASPTTLPPVFAAEARSNPPKAPETPKPAAAVAAKVEAPKAPPKAPSGKPMLKTEPPRAPANSIESIIAAAERDRASDRKSAPAEVRAPDPDPLPERPPSRERPAERPAAERPSERASEPAGPVQTKGPELKPRPKSQPVLVAKSDKPAPKAEPPRSDKPMPSIVARAQASKGRPISPGFGVAIDNTRRGPTIEPRRDGGRSGLAAARQQQPMEFDVPEEAMSAVREVEVEQTADAQGVVDRAIAALETEVRGSNGRGVADHDLEYDDEPVEAPRRNSNGRASQLLNATRGNGIDMGREEPVRTPRPAKEFATPRRASSPQRYSSVPRARAERSGFGAVSIFVAVFVVLLLGAGGAGLWAWQEGFINLDAMFGKGNTATAVADAQPAVTPDSTGPGNTETPATAQSSTELQGGQRLPAVADVASGEPLALQSPAGDKTEARLGAPQTAADATVAAIDPASTNGSQSLLLEASDNGTTGAVPFSGTIEWSKGADENGLPTIVGKANIPARNLSMQVLIRKNSDPSLPASHLMEINFTVSDSFIGGSIAGLPGVLLKNEELVQGAPLVGASARVVGNSFLFALSATPADSTANVTLLTSRKWMDLALIYASGKRAIITLEKDDKAQKLFKDVFASWGAKTANG